MQISARTFLIATVVGGISIPTYTAGQTLDLAFEATASEFQAAKAEYETIWATEAERIVQTLEEVSGLRFEIDRVEVEVMEGVSWAGTRRMGMRASYPTDTKKATLVHELGHVLVGDLVPNDAPEGSAPQPHYLLFLFLYDVWVKLWGTEFADEQVVVESNRRGLVDYEGIWKAVLSKSREERAAELSEIIDRWGAGVAAADIGAWTIGFSI